MIKKLFCHAFSSKVLTEGKYSLFSVVNRLRSQTFLTLSRLFHAFLSEQTAYGETETLPTKRQEKSNSAVNNAELIKVFGYFPWGITVHL